MNGRNAPCWCGSGKKWKKCCFPKHDPKASTSALQKRYLKQYQILLKNEEQIRKIRQASIFAATVLDKLCRYAKAGVTTEELNRLSDELHKEVGAIPAALGYGSPPFPKGICTSRNEIICHGIPNDEPLVEGDIVNIDVASILDGYFGDCSRMVIVGETTPERKLVCETAEICLQRAIAILKPGVLLCEIGDVITDYAESEGCSVVYQFVGHGVGVAFHEAPQVHHNRNEVEIPLAAGMTFTIEPMINAGVAEGILDPMNEWEVRTADGKASAQVEHTVLITDRGCERLTLPEG